MNSERQRPAEDRAREKNGSVGRYIAEIQWVTVQEDYSEQQDAWDYFTYDLSRSRAYRWGEDGLLGWTDRQCRVCFAPVVWNGKDPILKERLFGLNGNEGNHGEDVKESYYYLDASPTHSYTKGLYKYPQAEFPYAELIKQNKGRDKNGSLSKVQSGFLSEFQKEIIQGSDSAGFRGTCG